MSSSASGHTNSVETGGVEFLFLGFTSNNQVCQTLSALYSSTFLFSEEYRRQESTVSKNSGGCFRAVIRFNGCRLQVERVVRGCQGRELFRGRVHTQREPARKVSLPFYLEINLFAREVSSVTTNRNRANIVAGLLECLIERLECSTSSMCSQPLPYLLLNANTPFTFCRNKRTTVWAPTGFGKGRISIAVEV